LANRQLEAVETCVSAERLAPYRRTCGGDLAAAITLYKWNAAVSGALWVDLGHVEVLVRNAMHVQLTKWSARCFGEPHWYLDPGKLFSPQTAADVDTARARLTRAGKPDHPGRVVAELSFGFWRFLAAGHYELSLWRTCLYKGFPGQGRRRPLHDRLAALHDLRNRIAHLEPIHSRPLRKLYVTILTVADWINPAMRQWVAEQSTVSAQLPDRPAP